MKAKDFSEHFLNYPEFSFSLQLIEDQLKVALIVRLSKYTIDFCKSSDMRWKHLGI